MNASTSPTIQLFGTNKDQATRKAERWFKERGIKIARVDLATNQQRAQVSERGPAVAGRGERRGPRDENRGGDGGGGNRAPRANPFARPSKPVVSAPQAEALVEVDASTETAASPESDPEAVLDTPETSSAATAEAPPASDGASAPADHGDATVDATVDAGT